MTHQELRTTIGDNIRHWRTERGMTQGQLADKVGVDQSNISQFERGKAAPSINTLADIARVLGVPPDILLRTEIFSEVGA